MHSNRPFLGSEKVVLDDQPVLLGSLALQGHFTQYSVKEIPQQDKIWFWEVQGCDHAVCIAHSSQYLKLHILMFGEEKAALSLHIFSQFSMLVYSRCIPFSLASYLVLSKKFLSTSCSAPVRRAIPPCLCNPHEVSSCSYPWTSDSCCLFPTLCTLVHRH